LRRGIIVDEHAYAHLGEDTTVWTLKEIRTTMLARYARGESITFESMFRLFGSIGASRIRAAIQTIRSDIEFVSSLVMG